jgi:Uma2 family endonuclease
MERVIATVRMTASEFLEIPEDPDGSCRCQLVDGELVVNEPTWTHGRRQLVIGAALEVWTNAAPGRGRAGPPIDVLLDDRNVYGPDVVWYREGRAPALGDKAPYPLPDLAVEIRSPSTWRRDTAIKKVTYERHGVAELWLIDTAASVVLVFRRSEPTARGFEDGLELSLGETLTSPLLPGFALPVATIFAG